MTILAPLSRRRKRRRRMRQRKRARGRLETHVLVVRAAVAGKAGRVVVVVVVVVVFLLSSSFAEFNSRSCRRRWCSDDDLFVKQLELEMF